MIRYISRAAWICAAVIVVASLVVLLWGSTGREGKDMVRQEIQGRRDVVTVVDSVSRGKKSPTRLWLNPNKEGSGRETPEFIALCFHEVGYKNDSLSVLPSNFRKIVRELKERGYRFVNADDVADIVAGKIEQPRRAVLISFDDAYEDNYKHAFPIIKEEGIKATFFVIADRVGKAGRLSANEIIEMKQAGMCFGSHTLTHARLDSLPKEEIRREMNESKYVLEGYGLSVRSIAYPGGFITEEVEDVAKAYYDVGFTASMDADVPDTPFTIHRFGVFRWNDSLDSIERNG